MATRKNTAPTGRRSRAKSRKSPIQHAPGKGLTVATEAAFPASTDDKITVAKHIVQAVVAARDALQDENFDIHWPLSLVVELLEQASNQLDLERLGRKS